LNNELMHYGILGMKWGIRRYQNEDGTWTAAGKRRYKDDAKADKRRMREAVNKANTVGRAMYEVDHKLDRAVKKNRGNLEELQKASKALHEQYDFLESEAQQMSKSMKDKYGDGVANLETNKNGYLKGSSWVAGINNSMLGSWYGVLSVDSATRNRTTSFLSGTMEEKYTNLTTNWNSADKSTRDKTMSIINNSLSTSYRMLDRAMNQAYARGRYA